MLWSINCWCNSHRLAGHQHLWNVHLSRETPSGTNEQSVVYLDDYTEGWSVCLQITLHIYMLTCEPRQLSEDLWPGKGTWTNHLPGTVNAVPHPLPVGEVMHAIFSSIAPCGLTQAIRAPGCVTLSKSYCSLYQGFAALHKCTPKTTRYSVVTVCETNKYCT